MAKRRLEVVIAGDASGARKAFKDSDNEASSWSSKIKDKLGGIGPMLAAGAVAGVAGAAAFGVSAYNAAIESQKISNETARVIETTGASAWTSADQVGAYAGSLSELTGVDDEAIQSGANLLLTFTKVQNKVGEGNDVFDQATLAALDMSTAMGVDMRTSAMQIGKALNDPIAGMGKLSKAGVSFTEDQKDQIRTLQESGDVLGAQKVILGELAVEFGGAAEAAGTPVEKLMVKVGNLQEAFGAGLIPMVDKAVEGVESFGRFIGPTLSSIGENLGEIWTKVGPVAEGFAKLAGGAVVGALTGVLYALDGITGLLADNDAVFAAFVTVLGVMTVNAAVNAGAALVTLATNAFAKLIGAATTGVSSMAGMAAGMSLQQGAAVGAGIAIAGLAAAYTIWNRKLEETGDMAEQVGGDIETATKFDSYDEATSRVSAINSEIAGLSNTIENSSAPWDADYRAGLSQLGAELETSGTAIQQMVGNADAMTAATGASTEETWAWLQAQQEAGITFPTTAAAVDAYTGSVDTTTISAQDAAVAMEAQRVAAQDLNDTLRSAVDPLFAVQDANQKLVDAQKATLDALNAHGSASDEYKAASEAQTRAAFDLTYASTTLSGELGAQPALMDEATAGLDRMVEQGQITQEQANMMRDSFIGASWQAAALGQQNINVPVAVDMSRFYQGLNEAILWAGRQTITIGANVAARVGQSLPGFASGGYPGDGFSLVGEQGPELIHKQGSKLRVFSNSDSGAMVGGGGGGSQPIVITVQSVLDGRVIAESTRSEFIQMQKTLPGPVLGGVRNG